MAYALQHTGVMQAPPPMPASEALIAEKRRVRAWIEGIRSRFHVEVPDIAARAGVAPSTVYRWIDDAGGFSPSLSKIRKIAAAFSVPMPDDDARPPGFAEGEALKIEIDEQPAELRAGMNQAVWRLNTRALDLLGYLPGDLVLVDLAVTPRAGDVVCAQIYDFQRGTAETKIRAYEPPFLMMRSFEPSLREAPIYVDNERAVIMGVVTRSLRVRAG